MAGEVFVPERLRLLCRLLTADLSISTVGIELVIRRGVAEPSRIGHGMEDCSGLGKRYGRRGSRYARFAPTLDEELVSFSCSSKGG